MSLSKEEERYLENIYNNPKSVGSFGGLNNLYRKVQKDKKFAISKNQLKKWLQKQESYTLHKQVKRKFPRNKVVVGGINQQWDIDIADLSLFARQNKGYKYFLLSIDVFSKYVRIVPLKTKNADEVLKAFEKMINEEKPMSIHSDRGTEFTNKKFQAFLDSNHIKHFHTNNELKAMVAERAIKTIKLKIYKYFTHSKNYSWIDVISDITNTYNNTKHSTLKMAPNQVNQTNEDSVWNTLYNQHSLNHPMFSFNFPLI